MTSNTPAFVGGWQERIHSLRNIPPLMRIVWDSGPGVATGCLVFRAAGALVPLAMLSVSKYILDAVQSHFSGRPLPAAFWYLVAAEAALAAIGAIAGRLASHFDTLLADRFTRSISVKIMDHASRLDLASYEDPVFYDKLERARVQATDRINMIQAMGAVFQQLIAAATFSVGLLWFSPWLLVLLVAGVIPAFLGESYFAYLGYSLAISQTPVRRRLDYLRTVSASKESAKELKLFGLSEFLSTEYKRLFDDIYHQNVQLARRRLGAGMLLSLLSTAGYYGAYVVVIYSTLKGNLTWGSLQFLVGAIAGASSNIQSIFSTFANIADQSLFLGDLIEFLGTGPAIRSKPGAIPAPRPIRDGFVFEGVSFAYPGSDRLILDRLDLRIDRNERIALIGENGQGKTTIVKLLSRLYDPCEGRILLDGVDLRDYRVEDLHREISVIFQDFTRYEMTAMQNIAMGRLDAPEVDIRRAAKKSLADRIVRRLPGGFNQLLGRRFEGGLDLSGGEWQRIALARAYLRNAQVLILDEPTAALDARSEAEVFQQFAELTVGKMAIIISHRFSTVKMADRIVVLEGGRVAEQGSHQSLMALGRRYAEMFEMQAASYR